MFESLLCARHCRQVFMNFLSCPWNTRYYCHVFWSFDPSSLLNEWPYVVCSLFINSGHLEAGWCGVRNVGWNGLEPSGAGWARLLCTSSSQQLCFSVGPFLSFLSSGLSSGCLESRFQTTSVAAIVLTGQSPASGVAGHLWMGLPWVSACYPHPERGHL